MSLHAVTSGSVVELANQKLLHLVPPSRRSSRPSPPPPPIPTLPPLPISSPSSLPHTFLPPLPLSFSPLPPPQSIYFCFPHSLLPQLGYC